MIVSVVLAIVFPYRGDVAPTGDDGLLRAGGGVADYDVLSSSNAVGDVQIDVHDGSSSSIGGGKKEEDGANGLVSEGADNINDGSVSSVSLSGGRGDNNEEQTSDELLSPLDSSSTKVDNMNKQHGGGGLFDYDATPYDPTQQQAEEKQLASSINTSSSSLSSCQTNLQQADIDMSEIIDETEYISFLRHYIVNDNIVDEVNDFDELPIEYQVNFNHLATKTTQSNSGGSSSNGIPIATLEETQKVCLYISNKGSSAIDEFDWDQISTLKQQQQNEGM